MIVTAIGFFMVILDTTIVNVTLPTIQGDLGGGISGLQWIAGGYAWTDFLTVANFLRPFANQLWQLAQPEASPFLFFPWQLVARDHELRYRMCGII